MKKRSQKTDNFYSPKYWPFWCIIGLLILLSKLPYRLQLRIGKLLGYAIYYFSKKLRHIAEVNIDLCFPELSKQARNTLVKDNCIASGIAIVETAFAWYGSEKRLRPLAHITGGKNVEKAKAAGRGVLILGPHLMTLEIAGRLFSLDLKVCAVYRAHKKPFINFLIENLRKKYSYRLIERNNVFSIVKALKKGEAVWYTPDIDAGYFQNIFVPFFGVEASCLIAPSRLAKLTGAKTLLSTYYRRDDGTGYDIHISEPLENFPSDDTKKDIQCINQLLEKAIREKPEQYLWQYKRFKTRPNNEPRFY